jgi:hypothetical protein
MKAELPAGLDEAQLQLLKRIFASQQFAHADSLKRILQYVCERGAEINAPALKEHDIAVNAIRRPPSFDPKTDPIVRVSIAGIRERLRAYFETEGKRENLRLTIPKGQYKAVFQQAMEAREAEAAPRAAGLRKFWHPYLFSDLANVLIYAEVLFFRDQQGSYVRNIFVNDLATGPAEIQRRFPSLDIGQMNPSFHFLSAGEVYSMLSITRFFQEMSVPIEVRNSRFSSWNELRQSNLILLGSSRTNSFLNSLQNEEMFTITQDTIINPNPRDGEQREYRGIRHVDGKLERLTEWAVITRRPGLTPSSTVTMVAANHGRAIEGAGQYVTREDKMAELADRFGTGLSAFPASFQVLLRVDMIDFDEEVVNVEYVSHRTY